MPRDGGLEGSDLLNRTLDELDGARRVDKIPKSGMEKTTREISRDIYGPFKLKKKSPLRLWVEDVDHAVHRRCRGSLIR